MRVGIVREIGLGERRVAATPDTTKRLIKLGFEVQVEAGAGELASFQDADYESAGASIAPTATEVWDTSDLVLKVRPPDALPEGGHEADHLREGATLISFIWPSKNPELVARLSGRKVTVLAMDQIPRITRAQKMDALSSMANIAGYRAVIEAASFFGRFFTGQMTAAGKVPPAKVMVIGAGVAGLAAIGAARSLGAIVRAFDTRPGVKEQIESMGAEFLELQFEEEGAGEGGYAKEMSPAFIAAEMALFAEQARDVDIIITTALIPGRPAPVLITPEMVESMKKGSVIVDLAAENGGNCALTQPERVITHRGITIIGYVDLPSRLAPTASQLYGSNLCHMIADMGGAKAWHIDREDEVIRGALIMENGEVCWPPPRIEKKEVEPAKRPSVKPVAKRDSHAVALKESRPKQRGHGHGADTGRPSSLWPMVAAAVVIAAASQFAPPEFVAHLTVFVLACFVGWQVVWNVTPALHTPLMSVTNAVSGIILVGGMLNVAGPLGSPATLLGALALLLSAINVAGGFLVTQRMLKMFAKSPEEERGGQNG
ncbi:MAG: Re/Si-specific NAD(P)(+) transhydrogenase subunit alpha [Polyangiaceae bacterium]|nr:Re/Si-specific NAD(P)(+) transhydrogenase subunit alpha [Polyangiaceae bacterium]